MDLNPVTNAIVRMALDASVVRHSAISTNIANANTQGFTPLRVSFEDQLSTEKTALLERREGATELARLNSMQPRVELGDTSISGKVLIDREMVELSKNTLHYQALIKAMGKNTAILNMAINDGRQ